MRHDYQFFIGQFLVMFLLGFTIAQVNTFSNSVVSQPVTIKSVDYPVIYVRDSPQTFNQGYFVSDEMPLRANQQVVVYAYSNLRIRNEFDYQTTRYYLNRSNVYRQLLRDNRPYLAIIGILLLIECWLFFFSQILQIRLRFY